jgi:hypothetical protein
MTRRHAGAAVLAIALVSAACSSGSSSGASPQPSRQASAPIPTAETTPAPLPPRSGSTPPTPDARIPARPRSLARILQHEMTNLYAAIDTWLNEKPGGYPPASIELEALYLQRATRLLARQPGLEGRVVDRLPGPFGLEVQADADASRALFAHANPVTHPSRIRTQRPLPPATLLSYYREAQQKFGVPWEVLAAVNFVESKFGRVRSASSAGAQGPMQFIPSTWAVYGLGGDIDDPHDAILGAANYLHASGAPANVRGALYAYNPIRDYVDAVLAYAHQIERDPRSFYAYYEFQAFVFTKRGEVQLTGPGS